jgi:pilus assembly protein Flp/PilA
MVTVLRTPGGQYEFDQPMCTQELSSMKNLVSRFVKDESGATAIEYGLIAAGIAIAIITAVNGLGTKLSSNFNTISSSLK